MEKKTVGLIATVLSALACGCAALIACVFGGLIVSGTPFEIINTGGGQYMDTLPAPVGYVLLCLSVLFIAVPIVIGFLTLRKKPQPVEETNEPIPPAS